jgi:hypothetical protein
LMQAVIEEKKFDDFANDFYLFLALRYPSLRRDYRIKVYGTDRDNWDTIIPPELLRANQFHPYIAFDADDATAQEKTAVLKALGFTQENAETLAHYDAVIYLNFSRPARTRNGDTYMWNVLIAHYILHLVEAQTDQQLIRERPGEHDYEERESLEHLHRFICWVGGPAEAVARYIPCKD